MKFIKKDGKFVKRAGKFLRAVVDAFCLCCKGIIIPPFPRCASKATCNQPCDDSYAAYEQSECCDCECAGRKAYPTCYNWQLDGVMLKEIIPSSAFVGHYFKILDVGPYSFNGSHSGALPGGITYCSPAFGVRWERYNASDELQDSGTSDFLVTGTFALAQCEDESDDESTLHILWTLNAPVFHEGGAGQGDIEVSRCTGGSGGGGASNDMDDIGTMTITPTCTVCSLDLPTGVLTYTPCQTFDPINDQRASVCSNSINLAFEHDSTLFIVALAKTDGCTNWQGLGSGDESGNIETATGDGCCGGEGDPCASDPCHKPRAGPSCGCWLMRISVGGQDRYYRATGSCPPTTGWAYDSDLSTGPDDISNIQISYPDNCP